MGRWRGALRSNDFDCAPAFEPRADRWLGLRLCLMGFIVNFKPSEPFLTRYLLEVKGLSEHELATRVWPFSTWGAFAFMLPAGLLAESLGSRSVILCGLLFRESTRILLLYGEGVGAMAAMQLTYAASIASDSIYFAHVYAAAPPERFVALTAAVQAAYHAGNFAGSVVGQVWVSAMGGGSEDGPEGGLDGSEDTLRVLFYVSWGSASLALVAFAFLPPPRRALPPSLASLLRSRGWRAAWGELRGLLALSRGGSAERFCGNGQRGGEGGGGCGECGGGGSSLEHTLLQASG